MAVPKNTQTRFVGITYHIHYTSLRLLFEQPCTHVLCSYGAHVCRNGKSIHGSISKYSDTLHTESGVYDVICREKQAQGCIVDVIRNPYKPCLCIFWHCHPYFILQFYSIVFYTCKYKESFEFDEKLASVCFKSRVTISVTNSAFCLPRH